MQGILHRMSQWLVTEDRSEYGSGCFAGLQAQLAEAGRCAADNYNNRFRNADEEELRYVSVREKQSVILQEIYENIKSLQGIPGQALAISELFGYLEQHLTDPAGREDNGETALCKKELEHIFEEMKKEPLPKSREEFEDRALLFHILKLAERLVSLEETAGGPLE